MTTEKFKLRGEYIELFKLMKITGLSQSGGEAKSFVSQGLVKVNGQIELRKACKIQSGQKVEFGDTTIEVE